MNFMHILLGFGIGGAVSSYGGDHDWSLLKIFGVSAAVTLPASLALSYFTQVLTK